MINKKKLDTAPYKGVRDFYPEDMYVLNYITSVMKKTAESFGYSEYNASPLEPAELYKAKTGEEIISEQTYTFTDRGGREVTLRPEMTPTVARMVAARKRDLSFPLRWYSIPNMFRYENPQKGRLREHYQLNMDIFGASGLDAEAEIIETAWQIMKNFGAKDNDFQIRINSRLMLDDIFSSIGIKDSEKTILLKILDKKDKISADIFTESVKKTIGNRADEFLNLFEVNQRILDHLGTSNPNVKNLVDLIERLDSFGIKNIQYTPSLVRGFDYYTDIVFEIFDTNTENKRALFGGGRYDNLLDIFGGEKVPAVGYGMGDVTIRDFLLEHNLIPKYKSKTDLFVCQVSPVPTQEISFLASRLRASGINVAIDLSKRKIGDQIKNADKMMIPFIVCVGEEEIKNKVYKIKNLESGEEKTLQEKEIADFIKASK